ncbi:hypothetical protein [Streptomyces sp. KL116D]
MADLAQAQPIAVEGTSALVAPGAFGNLRGRRQLTAEIVAPRSLSPRV